MRVTEWWSRPELEALQLAQLRQLLRHAYEDVPYYHDQFDRLRLRPEDFRSLDDLQLLPLLTKDVVRRNPDRFLSRKADAARPNQVRSGGPMPLHRDQATADLHETTFRLRQWMAAGYQPGDRLATLIEGDATRPGPGDEEAWWDYDSRSNEITLSLSHTTEARMGDCLRLLAEFRPQFISAQPRSLETLCRFMRRHHLHLPGVEAVFCQSETVFPEGRRLIEDQLGCPLYARYDMGPRVAHAAECDRHRGYHVNMEYGVLELVDGDGRPITEPGVPGLVVGTGFDTYRMPLIRYVTDDVAEYAEGECDCGRHSPLVRHFRRGLGARLPVSVTHRGLSYAHY
ncbi:MAG: hypothetical protein ACOYEW_09540 [Anaerolineae bacterium]